MEKDLKCGESSSESKTETCLSAQEGKKIDAEWLENLVKLDKGSWFRESLLLTLNQQPVLPQHA